MSSSFLRGVQARGADQFWSRRSCSVADREAADAEASGLEHDDGAVVEILGTGGKVGEKECGLLFGATLGATPEEHERRLSFLPQRENCSEVGVGRDDNALLGACALDDLLVCGGLQVVGADVDGVVACVGKSLGDPR